MRLVSFEVKTPIGPADRLGAVLDGVLAGDADGDTTIVDLTTGYGLLLRADGDPRWAEIADATLPADMLRFLEGGEPAMGRARQVLAAARQLAADTADRQLLFRRGDVKLLAPVPHPRSLRDFSQYEEHMTRARGPGKPPLWYRYPNCYKGNPSTVVGADDPILWPAYTDQLDPELELAAIVNRRGRNIPIDQAMEHVAGYTIFVDPSARDVQFRETLGPYKGKDFCTLMGPCLVTPDEFDEMDARCGIRVNGEQWFEGNTGRRRHFATPELVAYASDGEDLIPGDVIAGGTISFGCSMDLDRWVQPGDVCEYWIEGIGTIRTTIVREPRRDSFVRKGLPGRLELPPEAREQRDVK